MRGPDTFTESLFTLRRLIERFNRVLEQAEHKGLLAGEHFRHRLVASAMVTTADGFAEREAAKTMIDDARPAADNPQADTSRACARWEKFVRRRREGRGMRRNGAQKVENEPNKRDSLMMRAN